jgi:hypothetical protein
MKRLLIMTISLALLAGAAMAQKPDSQTQPVATPGPVPIIDVVEKVKDFGVISKGEQIQAVFEVKNKGQAPLEISQVRPTCGCTVADFDKTVPPGGTGKVRANVDTSAFNGPITKAVLVFSNDPATPQLNLVIKAEIRSMIEAVPRNLLLFRSVLQGETATEKTALVSADGSPFKILGLSVKSKDYEDSGKKSSTGAAIWLEKGAEKSPYEIAVRELLEKDRLPDRKGPQYEISVTVPANAPEGMLNDRIIVKTDMAKAAEVPLTITGAVRAIIQVVPSEINLGKVKGDAPVGQPVLFINNRQGVELQISDAKIDNPAFTAEVNPLQAGQRYQVVVTLKAGAPKGAIKATLKVSTNDALRKVIEVPVQVTVE